MSEELEATTIEKSHTGEIVIAAVPLGETKQTEPEDMWTPNEAIVPPHDPVAIATISESSPVRAACLDAIARNTVGLGYEVIVGETGESPDQEELDATRNTLEQLARRDTRLDKPTFTDLMYQVKLDEEECGIGALEVSRSKISGQIDGLFYVPGKYVRRLRSRQGWIVGRTNHVIAESESDRFYNFGDKVQYDSDGAPMNKLQRGRRWKQNELLVFRLPNSESRDYGVPRDLSLLIDYAAAKLASEWNVGFFDSSGTPPTVIFVQGVETREGQRITYKVDESLVTRIGQSMKSDGQRQHRVAIIPVPPGTKTDAHQLGQLSERDMGFQGFQDSHARRVIARFRLQPIFVPFVSDDGRYEAEVQRAITLEQVFDPEQVRYEERLWQNLLYDIGVGHLRIKFTRLAVESNAVKRDSADKLAETGNITRREQRAAHGLPPFPEGEGEGMFPVGFNDELVSKSAPVGVEDRVTEGDGQQGLRPGIAGREVRQPEGDYSPEAKARNNGQPQPSSAAQ